MILIIGAGAVGTALATGLASAKRDVALYVRPKDVSAFNGAGQLRLDTQSGSTQAALPPLVRDLDLAGVDYLLICVKSGALPALMEQLPRQIPSGCTVVCTLNGVEALRQLRIRWPQAAITPLSVMSNSQLVAPLHARLTTRAELVVGGGDAALKARLANVGFDIKLADGDEAVWGKLLINLSSAICALTRATFKDLLQDPHLRAIYVSALDEAISTMNAAGIAWKLPLIVPSGMYRWMLNYAAPLPWWFAKYRNGVGEGAYPSMVADVNAGRLTEVQELNGEIVRLGKQTGIATPINARLLALIESEHSSEPIQPFGLRKKLKIS